MGSAGRGGAGGEVGAAQSRGAVSAGGRGRRDRDGEKQAEQGGTGVTEGGDAGMGAGKDEVNGGCWCQGWGGTARVRVEKGRKR